MLDFTIDQILDYAGPCPKLRLICVDSRKKIDKELSLSGMKKIITYLLNIKKEYEFEDSLFDQKFFDGRSFMNIGEMPSLILASNKNGGRIMMNTINDNYLEFHVKMKTRWLRDGEYSFHKNLLRMFLLQLKTLSSQYTFFDYSCSCLSRDVYSTCLLWKQKDVQNFD